MTELNSQKVLQTRLEPKKPENKVTSKGKKEKADTNVPAPLLLRAAWDAIRTIVESHN